MLGPLLNDDCVLYLNVHAVLRKASRLFAGDVKVYERVGSDADVRSMQRQLDSVCRCSARWGMALNTTKYNAFTLTLRRLPVTGAYTVAGVEFERANVMCELSVWMDGKLAFNEQVDAVVC